MSEENECALKPEHQFFVDEYLIDLNATKAYMRVYPNCEEDSARRCGSRLLTNVDIKEEISNRVKALRDIKAIEHEKILRELEAIAYSDLTDFVEWGTIKLAKEEDEYDDEEDESTTEKTHVVNYVNFKKSLELGEKSRAVAEISQTKHGIKIKLYDKMNALNSLAKYRGLIEESEDEDDGPRDFGLSYNRDDLRDR